MDSIWYLQGKGSGSFEGEQVDKVANYETTYNPIRERKLPDARVHRIIPNIREGVHWLDTAPAPSRRPDVYLPRSPAPAPTPISLPSRSRSQSPVRGGQHASVVDYDQGSNSDSWESSRDDGGRRRHARSKNQRRRQPPRDSAMLTIVPRSSKSTQEDDLIERLEFLERENHRLRSGVRAETPLPAAPTYTFQIFHCFDNAAYLDEPHWVPGEGDPRLRSSCPVRNIDYYIDQHPEIAFVFYRDYESRPPADRTKFETKDGVYRTPLSKNQSLSLVAPSMVKAVEELVQEVPEFGEYFPYFDPEKEIKAPYLFMYYCMPFIPDVLPKLNPLSRNLVNQLQKGIKATHGHEYTSATLQAKKGLVARHLFKYLIRPGDILVNLRGPATQAFIALDWAEEVLPAIDGDPEDYELFDHLRRKRTPKRGPKAKPINAQKSLRYTWQVPVSHWEFDGAFEMREELMSIKMKVGYEEESVRIDQLNFVPLKYAPEGLWETLERRGKMFWKLRQKRFVTYHRREDQELSSVRQA